MFTTSALVYVDLQQNLLFLLPTPIIAIMGAAVLTIVLVPFPLVLLPVFNPCSDVV